ncbi:MAG: hypothetical protein EXS18_03960 [Verrucomicrobiae bacterium]|nr:hypothetical protein [Verrucomicrobiae bacterium]
MLFLGAMFLSCRVFAQDPAGAATKVREWDYIPRYGGKEIPRPADEEFLKLVPPLRPVPLFAKSAQNLGMAIWWGDYSVQLFSEQPPLPADLTRKAEVQTPAGEDEPLVLGLWGLRNVGSVNLTVKNTPLPMTIRRVNFAPRYVPGGSENEPRVKGGRVLGIANFLFPKAAAEVSAGANTVFWINICVPADTKPGKYTASLELAVQGSGKVIPLPVTIQVLNYRLPKAEIVYGMYFRPFHGSNLPDRFLTREWLRLYFRDMARHGMTSASLYNRGTGAKAFFQTPPDKEGRVSLGNHPEILFLRDMMEDGLVTRNLPIMYLAGGIEPDGSATAIKNELTKLGLPEFLIYGPDEPAVNDQSLATFQSRQPYRKDFRLVTAITERAATAYADLLDVWVVNGGLITPELRQLAARKGAEVWTYDCAHRGSGNSTWSRFYAGLYTWALELTGNWLWCYTEGFYWEGGKVRSGEENIDWFPTHAFVLTGDEGIVPSIEWEARREGVEDYRTLRMLQKLIEARPESAVGKKAAEWLTKTKSRVDWNLGRTMPFTMYPWDVPEVYPSCPNFEPSELSEVRMKAIDYINRLSTK